MAGRNRSFNCISSLKSPSPNSLRNLFDIQAPRRSVDNLFVDAAFLVDFVGVATLLHATVFERVNVVGIDDLRDAVRDDDDGAVLLDSVDAVLDLLGGNGIETGRGLVKEDDGGFLRNIRAMATRCCRPPERSVALCANCLGRSITWS